MQITILLPLAAKKKKTQMTKNPSSAFIFNRLQLYELIWAYFPGEART